ncbi:50S ribosomal protein L37ae [Candidatus Woesearchaeota archaeon]|nr:MAG: large subunit ribosomal protein L37Ae [archaeon GW2011_AR18]MBS3161945.1 50S ribosomal protein L37ae [Candidatus Woesearchaeota archaeon]HIH25804.1 50S ribosomal protein L37ae [Nanoarchaeota archaeon]
MAAGTKKIGSAGRYGVRYGATIKQKVVDIEKKQKATYECPSCHKITVKRLAKGIWKCYKCSHTFAAKAFSVGE